MNMLKPMRYLACVVLLYSIIDWNNPLIINKMFRVYLGDIPLKTKVRFPKVYGVGRRVRGTEGLHSRNSLVKAHRYWF